MASSDENETANIVVPRPVSSFKGRLDMENFRFKPLGTSSPGTQMTPRRSTRLSSTPSRTSSPQQASKGSPASPSVTRKRKAAALSGEDTAPAAIPDGPTEVKPGAEATSPTPSSPLTPQGAKKKRSRQKSTYQPPSVYSHLPYLPDAMAPNLLVLFCGLNPGVRTAQTGHAYNHPSNLFWKLMYSSGVLPVRCTAEEDRTLPARFQLGLTNIVSRPSRNGAELSKAEMDEGVSVLEEKVRRWRPEVVCMVGKSIWESVWRVRHGRAIAKGEFKYGWQDESENMGRGEVVEDERQEGVEYGADWDGARVFVSSSTSGLAATLGPEEKERIWRELGSWVEMRRAERLAAV
ncbi:G/U mismatch-specific uracil DNA glycosylase [Cytospora mali]|uniref:G/U mismatch-specific uracil DNA glycosylase n=1 Tax=Cytospora mali TaxID=578113 RepID=A0A194VDE3_CYTMA|nr:G/U mismatch-specific uracil DNA glycosylase [Valsa mali var. pyri (nom. inval.)]